ncbi:hypothetical protein D3C85_451210 [compost metagenome]
MRARAGARAHARTGRASLCQLPQLWRQLAAAQLCRVWRRAHRAADQQIAQGPRRTGGHAGPLAGLADAGRRQVRAGANPGAGRGRPHAGPGLRARARYIADDHAQAAPDPAVLGHFLGRDSRHGENHAEGSRLGRGQRAQQHGQGREAIVDRVRQETQAGTVFALAEEKALGADIGFRQDAQGCRAAREHLAGAGRARRFDSRRQDAAEPPARAGPFQIRRSAGAGGYRRGCPRPRYRPIARRRQFRLAHRGGRLYPPHRPHGPRGRLGRSDLARLRRRGGVAVGRRSADAANLETQ